MVRELKGRKGRFALEIEAWTGAARQTRPNPVSSGAQEVDANKMVEVAGVEPACPWPLYAASTVYSVALISPGVCRDARLAPSQLPGEGTVRSPRVAPRTMPAVVASFG